MLLLEAGMGPIAMGATTLSSDLNDSTGSFRLGMINFTKTDLPNTLEEIKSTWPEILGQNPFDK
jgi:hypothetical protein